MKIRILPILTLLICIFCSCTERNPENKEEKEIYTMADSFATKYYCLKFKDAIPFSDEKYQQHLKFLSSNITEKDIDILKNSKEIPEFSINKINIRNNNEAEIMIGLRNIYILDSIGTKPSFIEETTQTIVARKINNQWKVSDITD